ncbi:MAG: WecB/TagA/CpsF family glycosyltransferase, partial [Chloroflexi bacterium]|nr:WecB/TagA/CpsF family glycosyltransferase [Chloroflexota bacterium]
AGSPSLDEEDGILEHILLARPDLLLVAFGAPAQEKWIARNLSRLGIPFAMGIGGALDFIAGKSHRAPRFLQRLGLEWLYRLIREPWRWRRMSVLPRFAMRVLLEKRRATNSGEMIRRE